MYSYWLNPGQEHIWNRCPSLEYLTMSWQFLCRAYLKILIQELGQPFNTQNRQNCSECKRVTTYLYFAETTVQILCIGTDRSQQTVQTKIRLLLRKQSDQGRSSLIRVYAVCHSISIFWMHWCNVTSNFSIFRTIMAIVRGVPNFRIFTVSSFKLLRLFPTQLCPKIGKMYFIIPILTTEINDQQTWSEATAIWCSLNLRNDPILLLPYVRFWAALSELVLALLVFSQLEWTLMMELQTFRNNEWNPTLSSALIPYFSLGRCFVAGCLSK